MCYLEELFGLMDLKIKTSRDFMVEYKNDDFCNIFKKLDLETMTFFTSSYVLTFKDDIVRYIYNMTPINFKKFKRFEEKLFEQFLRVIQFEKNRRIYVVSYQSGWEKSDRYYKEKIDTEKGMLVTDEVCVIREIFENAVRYKAFPVFIDGTQNMAVIPTDHLDLFIVTDISLDEIELDKDTFNVKAG